MTKLCLSLLLIPAALCAQQSNAPLISASKNVYHLVNNYVLKAAQEMPEENYSFKPTPDVRSFGQLVGHVADAQYAFCGTVLADGTKPPGAEKTKTSKADLIQALQDGFAYCDKAYASVTTDAQASETVKFFGHDSPKLIVLDFNTTHTDEHYGNMVTYLRLKGITPPSSQKRD